MSLRITKAGVLDTVQDNGRHGFAHLGINPGGAMDLFSYRLSNALLGNNLNAPCLELHYPAAQVLFQEAAIICLSGADFTPFINKQPVPLYHPIYVPQGSLLQFTACCSGARAYLAFAQRFVLQAWLNSYSTNLKAGGGGFKGRALKTGDVLCFQKPLQLKQLMQEVTVLPWTSQQTIKHTTEIQFIIGNEWNQLTEEAQLEMQSQYFQITIDADRMGYRLAGARLSFKEQKEMLSSGVSFGTVQLLPNGQLIVLMADHQTTGGYPRIAQVIAAHLPLLAQKKPNDVLNFVLTDLATAENKIVAQQVYLNDLQLSCAYQMEAYLQQ
jgi:antagonist of KipI